MSSIPIKILLVEDDELFRLGLRVRLQQEPGLEIVAEAEDGETAIELLKQIPLDVVLLDVGLPGIGGIEACKQIKQQNPLLPVLVFTSHSQKPLITRLIEAGAQGYCLKGIAAEKLVLALRSVASGASWWDATATQEIRSSLSYETPQLEPENRAKLSNPLTGREQEILSLLAAGKTNQEIAHQLCIAPGTVRVHIHAILQKLEVSDRTQAVLVALQKQLIKSQ
ncbi:two component transcriptional regulator, LuxR family (plasmid) [Trichormus variabilis ATCC 29413]|uniref:Two component transcriptional regulator, LuxR family n=2 Tax=Anabaena variabilis TaxID=264691 RepID=Q3M265_TRIV2|nr:MULTISPECIES: response regulator transcription factor [Nostocaceae]ABA24921.1 two component transcriptional regulator, LuxR family [Trichormus variabilis ATCC 29413]MBC1217969.1 response regulator transcription factor [Trichormus variabilis ARAD]MBC1259309.1 response regulator transcription factor [Trichormus variabilis V5]MBC1270739.1 response regulator transcription factor [Trichormus variabilis FSR]MBC1305641.1 response regulator transcription factor [Trichormus variabilis N2B]